MITATLENQFAIQTSNGVGAADQLTDIISNKASANIRSLWGNEESNRGQFYVITDKNLQVFETLRSNGFVNTEEQEVLVLRVQDERGNAAHAVQKLAEAGINIFYLYTTIFDNQPAIVVNTDNNQKAFALFA